VFGAKGGLRRRTDTIGSGFAGHLRDQGRPTVCL
jgi:hypothetical protein